MAVLHKEFYKNTGSGQQHIAVNQDIRKYIEQTPDRDFSDILSEDSRWQVFYHLSDMRTSVLNWYEWKKNASLLEIGGEFGALTGLFCERCSQVATVEYGLFKAEAITRRYQDKDNLHVYAGRLTDMSFDKTFDYIVMIGSLERQCGGSVSREDYEAYLRQIRTLLKPNGILLLAVENRYGIKYFCGEPDPYTKLPFSGINHYPAGGRGYTFSRQEMKDILSEAGYRDIKFYYPLPDYKLTQMVYTDDYLPKKDLGERILFYHTNQETLLVPEQDLYADIIDNGVFPFLANSFLLECALGEGTGTAVFAAVTTDRGRTHGLSTSIHQVSEEKDKWIVKKRALCQEGQRSIESAYNHIKELEHRGIPVVSHKMEDEAIVMPYVPQITCSDYLRKLAAEENREQFEFIFELIYKNILKSSDIVPGNENAISDTNISEKEWGPVLKQCFVDMVPFNCFFIDGELIYFDQEFVRGYVPAAYPMFRALMYTYHFIPGAEGLVPLEDMKKRYGLLKLWDVLSKEEECFVAYNRRHNVYRNFYQWTRVDTEKMYRNARLLGRDL